MRAQLGFYGSTPAYAFQFDRLGLDGLGGQLNALLKQGDLAGQAALLTDEVLAHFTVTATWADLPAALAERYAGRAATAGGLPRRAAVAPRSVDARHVGRGRPGPSRRGSAAIAGAATSGSQGSPPSTRRMAPVVKLEAADAK